MTYIERLLTDRGRAKRRLGEQMVQGHMNAMQATANQPRSRVDSGDHGPRGLSLEAASNRASRQRQAQRSPS